MAGMHGVPTQGGRDIGDGVLPQQIERRIATGGEIGRRAVFADLAGVIAQGYIRGPSAGIVRCLRPTAPPR
jgi:hypothetical protein